MHSKMKGTLAESKVIADLYQKGFSVAIPLDDLKPFDLICIDPSNNMYKIQVKYCKLENGAASLPVRSCMSNKTLSYTHTYNKKEVDIFAMYVPEVDSCFYIKSDILDWCKGYFSIRIQEPKQRQKNINYADNFRKFPCEDGEDRTPDI